MYRYYSALLLLSFLGIVDASYLTYEHFAKKIPPCSLNILFADCGKVLTSQYSTFLGIPVAIFGIMFYLTLFMLTWKLMLTTDRWAKPLLGISFIGFGMSLYFVYLQLFVIRAICFYCMISATNSTLLLIVTYLLFKKVSISDKTYEK